jgi:lipase chaperone LimK
MNWRRPLTLTAIVLLASIALGWLLQGPGDLRVPTASAPSAPADGSAPAIAETRATNDSAPDPVRNASAAPAMPLPSLPASLQGTDSDGGVTLDASGRLVPDLALRRLYDHFLSSIGERSIDEIRALLAARLDAITTPEGKRQALEVFERYLRYLREVDSAAAQLSALPLRERLAMLSDLRRQHLGSEMAAAFFNDEEAYQRYTLDSRELAEDSALSSDERAARQREITAALPDAVRIPLLEQQGVEADLADAEAIDTLASDAAERHRLRSARYGEEAAARMELLDRERTAWDARVAAYRSERERLQALDAATRQAALDAYLMRNFDEAEQRRIRSLEGIGEL